MRNGNDKYFCPLLQREIFWGDCVEIDDIRNDNMDYELFGEEFNVEQAHKICEECKWYINKD